MDCALSEYRHRFSAECGTERGGGRSIISHMRSEMEEHYEGYLGLRAEHEQEVEEHMILSLLCHYSSNET